MNLNGLIEGFGKQGMSDKIIYLLSGLSGLLIMALFVYQGSQSGNEDLIKEGKYWSTDCILKEVDIPTGFLTSNINRLDCSGVIVNVMTDKYDSAVSAYNKYK